LSTDEASRQYLNWTLENLGLTVSERAHVVLDAHHLHAMNQRAEAAAARRPGQSVVSIANEPTASPQLAIDLGVEVAAILTSRPPPSPCLVRVGVPKRMRSFYPSLATAPGESPNEQTSIVQPPCLSRSLPPFSALAKGELPTESEVLSDGRISIAVYVYEDIDTPRGPDIQRWPLYLMHQLTARWTGAACICCS
jgi:hypothetical protein